MLRSHSMLAVAAVLGTGAAAEADHAFRVHAPQGPSITTKAVHAPKAPAGAGHRAALKVKAPTVAALKVAPPDFDLTPADCTSSACSTSDPTRLAGTVVSFNGTTLTETTTTSRRTYTATVNNDTTVVCPSEEAISNGHVFNPVLPSITKPGSGQPSSPTKPQMKDQYACSTTDITAGRHIAGAELGRDASGHLYWIAIALAPH